MVATPLSRLDLPPEGRLRLATQHWANSFQCALDDACEVSHFMIVRFEDLLREPERWLRAICSFAQLDYDPSMLPAADHRIPLGSTGSAGGDHKWYPLRPDVNRPYLESLEAWMVEVIGTRVRELANRWKYSPEGP